MPSPQLFNDIEPLLLLYKNGNALIRQAMLLDAIAAVEKLSGEVTTKNAAKKHYKELAYAATLINYADVLKRMEQQDFFDILADFNGMELTEELQDWFEMKNFAQMKLKKPLADYNPEIWGKFRNAQKEHLKINNKEGVFNLDELDINNPPVNQLYPLQIQMLGKLHNEAVDRISVNNKGEIRFAERFGFYLLPGGGMVEINDSGKIEVLKLKMLEEHLEEEHANLWQKAAPLYNALNRDEFQECLLKVLKSEKTKVLPQLFLNKLEAIAGNENTNALRLRKIVTLIDQQKYTATDGSVKKTLDVLRAQIQVQTFALTPLFTEAFAYVKANTKMVDIQQYLDTRAAGGFQKSHTFIMAKPLEEWFKEKFGGIEGEFGDDIRDSKIERLTLLQSITQFRKVKYSHLLIGLAAYNEALDNNTLEIEQVWNRTQFAEARDAIISEGKKRLTDAKSLFNLAVEHLKEATKTLPLVTQKTLESYLRELVLEATANPAKKEIAFAQFTRHCKETLEGKHATALKTILTITAVTIAAAFAGTVGFGIGFALGLWSGPGAFVTAVAGANAAALGVVATAGISGGVAGVLTGVGLFKPSKEMAGLYQFGRDIKEIIDPTYQIEQLEGKKRFS